MGGGMGGGMGPGMPGGMGGATMPGGLHGAMPGGMGGGMGGGPGGGMRGGMGGGMSGGMGGGIPEAGYDPAIEAKLADMGFPSGPRSRRPSNTTGAPNTVDLTYGGAPFGAANGAAMRASGSQSSAGMMPTPAGGMVGLGGGGGIIPGGPDGYSRDRRVSQRSRRESFSGGPGMPGGGLGGGGLGANLAPGGPGMPGGGMPYMRSPNGQIVPLGDPNMGASPSRMPISQIPPSPGRGLGRGSPYNAQPTYGGLPASAAGPQANISQYTAAQAFARPPNPTVRFSSFQPFPIFNNMDEMYEMLPEVPPLPAALVDHDVLFEDWARWMTVSSDSLILQLPPVADQSCVV